MSKIILNTAQSQIIDDCCKKLGIKDDYKTNTTLYDSVTELGYICDELQYALNRFQDTLIDLKMSVTDHDTEKLVQSLKEISDLSFGFSQSGNDISKATKDAVTNFKSVSEKVSFTLLCDDKHIQEIIDDNLCIDTTLSIGYQDGKFALIFCELPEDETESAPFTAYVIAQGEKEAYDDVQKYVERFLDL